MTNCDQKESIIVLREAEKIFFFSGRAIKALPLPHPRA